MKFSTTIAALATFVAGVVAQNPNSFSSPLNDTVVYTGATFVIQWNSTGGGDTVDLLLKKGDPNNLDTVFTIGNKIPNQGAVKWAVPTSLPSGNQYALEIVDDANPNAINYSPFFQIVNNVTGTTVIGATTSAASSTAVSSSVASSSSAANSTTAESSSVVSSSTAVVKNTTTTHHTTAAAGKTTGSASGSGASESATASDVSSTSAAASTTASETTASTGAGIIFGANGLVVAGGIAAAMLAL
ncbi:hypothetical protein AWJ20_2376 [Sugiyamaella lignohabitans]|uniref:Yeast cell wall synthesis Kre9/Knh1-like N-terminal domain-containing protein n=1 Tax=Sugiyamaella lignohabitans TaxID=796027 RepID=A0A167F386_9ASCO|nr:uncharacterized protein AWJ20_2376 [Sugiyamaella lignohabitans]ANB14769.1 hypothetical protein AWJ20_2376 [Sugiyamaella lignohabitans]